MCQHKLPVTKHLSEMVKTGVEKRKRDKYHRPEDKRQRRQLGKKASIIQDDIQMTLHI